MLYHTIENDPGDGENLTDLGDSGAVPNPVSSSALPPVYLNSKSVIVSTLLNFDQPKLQLAKFKNEPHGMNFTSTQNWPHILNYPISKN